MMMMSHHCPLRLLVVLTAKTVLLLVLSTTNHHDTTMFVNAFVISPTTTNNNNGLRQPFRTNNNKNNNNVGPNHDMGLSSSSSSSSESTTTTMTDQTMTSTSTTLLSVSLTKPMGMILEEVQEGQANGVYVKELAEGGTAIISPWKDELVGLTIASVMGKNVLTLDFDSVMDELINAPSPVELQFAVSAAGPDVIGTTDGNNNDEIEEEFSVGTVVTIKVLEDNDTKETIIQAKVGDNLRQTLFDNNVEVYRGFKAKIGNCNGGGQCTYCRADFVETEGWAPRSEYEDKKLKNAPDARLTCLNSIQGPATIRM